MFALKFNRIANVLSRKSINFLKYSSSSSVINERIEYFEGRLGDWWEPNGSYIALHKIVPFRVNFMLQELGKRGMIKEGVRPFEGLKMLDVGCGVGITSERLCELGGDVTGIEPSDKIIHVAKQHALNSQHKLQYHVTTVEDFVNNNKEPLYDVITVFWVLEHVSNKEEFLRNCILLLKPGGSLFLQNNCKSWAMFLSFIFWHVYMTQFAPQNVLSYKILSKNSDVERMLKDSGCQLVNVQGVRVNFIGNDFCYTNSKKYFNIFHAIK